MGHLNYHWGQFNFWNKFFNSVSLFYVIVIIIIIFLTFGRYVPEGV